MQALRLDEFNAGRYSGDSQSGFGQGARHSSIEEAIKAAGADGTASILDIQSVNPVADDGLEPPLCGVAYPLSREKLIELFGTDKPSPDDVEANDEFYDLILEALASTCWFMMPSTPTNHVESIELAILTTEGSCIAIPSIVAGYRYLRLNRTFCSDVECTGPKS